MNRYVNNCVNKHQEKAKRNVSTSLKTKVCELRKKLQQNLFLLPTTQKTSYSFFVRILLKQERLVQEIPGFGSNDPGIHKYLKRSRIRDLDFLNQKSYPYITERLF